MHRRGEQRREANPLGRSPLLTIITLNKVTPQFPNPLIPHIEIFNCSSVRDIAHYSHEIFYQSIKFADFRSFGSGDRHFLHPKYSGCLPKFSHLRVHYHSRGGVISFL
ncbi:MAG: hypothetical protein RLZZ74_2043 [Cyanobacteriota bacterium]|jgi:hypothetical protein